MNKYIGQQFNFYINEDSNTDVTSTKVTKMLESQTHALIFELYLTSKAGKFHSWDNMFIQLLQIDFSRRYYSLIEKAKIILGKKGMEMVRKTLPSSTTNW